MSESESDKKQTMTNNPFLLDGGTKVSVEMELSLNSDTK